MELVLLSGDLMLGARVEGAARQCELTVVTVADAARAIEAASDVDCRLLVVDLRVTEVDIAALVADVRREAEKLPIVACGPHVHETRLAAAREAGCDAVVTRGQLDREAESIFRQLLAGDL